MSRWVYEQNAMAACQEMRMESVVCPKPRRLVFQTLPDNDPITAYRWPVSHPNTGNSRAGAEFLDMILTKESYGENFSHQLATSPPFFWGSPPSRASNPLVQDEQFGNGNNTIYQPCEGPPSPSTRKGGCARTKFGHRPAAVRIEGFDCLNRDARNCSISAVA
ncbi:uncharacterized protein E5676_scaffold629G00560 [Cucumis melo var. makuwa]|uniref:Uncharacterized protein LOC103494124 n=2 Tax=Cucumis melo TaxID=3656 RepID=A0A1S3BVK5_CUCME|nr:uncharacterized protein LOC103494124 [Cucumis melo]KAA0058074.1 uncharacterized protein E6C27_scaffold274G003810 [Cucumis melo var. makuwa]TYK28426.1 uncharacterized protein E5676_scaffold629G00560 [Cucumis melo var. makuwa]